MALIIDVKVTPSAGTQKCTLDASDRLKISLKSAAEKGKANAELIKILSKKLGVSQEKISILLGKTARKKRIKIDADVSIEQVWEALGIERQSRLV